MLHVKTLPRPSLRPHTLLLRILCAATHAGDWHLIRGTPYFIRLLFGLPHRPTVQIPGGELCAVVEDVANPGCGFVKGDVVFGDVTEAGFGAFAEYIVVSDSGVVVKKPDNVSSRQAAASCTSALAALQAVRDVGAVKEGMEVLVNGASGGVGTFAVQMAKLYGGRVTAVCRKEKMELVRGLGADVVVDYGEMDVTMGTERYDVIVDAAGFRPVGDWTRVLKKGGVYAMVGGSTGRFFQVAFGGWVMGALKGVKVKFLESKPCEKDLKVIAELLEKGKISPLIDRGYPLEQVADAVRYIEERKVTGKVVIDISE